MNRKRVGVGGVFRDIILGEIAVLALLLFTVIFFANALTTKAGNGATVLFTVLGLMSLGLFLIASYHCIAWLAGLEKPDEERYRKS